jgi:hypothetical protein
MSQRITYVDKSTLNPSGAPENNKWSGDNGQEVKEVINSHADDIEALEASEASTITAEIQLTTSQIKSLNTTPIEIVAAPGAGKYIEIKSASLFLDYESSDYVASGGGSYDVNLKVGGKEASTLGSNPLFASVDRTVKFTNSSGSITHNTALTVDADNDFITGDSPMKIFVDYTIRDTN